MARHDPNVLGYDQELHLPYLCTSVLPQKIEKTMRDLYDAQYGAPVLFFCAKMTEVTTKLFPQDVYLIIGSKTIYKASKEGEVQRCIPLDRVDELVLSDDYWCGVKVASEFDLLVKPLSPKDSREMTDVLLRVHASLQTPQTLRVRRIKHKEKNVKSLLNMKKPRGYRTEMIDLEVKPLEELKKLQELKREIIELAGESLPGSPVGQDVGSPVRYDGDRRVSGRASPTTDTFARAEQRRSVSPPPGTSPRPQMTSGASPLYQYWLSLLHEGETCPPLDRVIMALCTNAPACLQYTSQTTPELEQYFETIDTSGGVTYHQFKKYLTDKFRDEGDITRATEIAERRRTRLFTGTGLSPRPSESPAQSRSESPFDSAQPPDATCNTLPVWDAADTQTPSRQPSISESELLGKPQSRRASLTPPDLDAQSNNGRASPAMPKPAIDTPSHVAHATDNTEPQSAAQTSAMLVSSQEDLNLAKLISTSPQLKATVSVSTTPIPLPAPPARPYAVVVGGVFADQRLAKKALKRTGFEFSTCVTLADAAFQMQDAHLLVLSLSIASTTAGLSALCDLRTRPYRPRVVGLCAAAESDGDHKRHAPDALGKDILGWSPELDVAYLNPSSVLPDKVAKALTPLYAPPEGTPVIHFCARMMEITATSVFPTEMWLIVTGLALYKVSKDGELRRCIHMSRLEELIMCDDYWIGVRIADTHDMLMKPVQPKHARDLADVFSRVQLQHADVRRMRVRRIKHKEKKVTTLLHLKKVKKELRDDKNFLPVETRPLGLLMQIQQRSRGGELPLATTSSPATPRRDAARRALGEATGAPHRKSVHIEVPFDTETPQSPVGSPRSMSPTLITTPLFTYWTGLSPDDDMRVSPTVLASALATHPPACLEGYIIDEGDVFVRLSGLCCGEGVTYNLFKRFLSQLLKEECEAVVESPENMGMRRVSVAPVGHHPPEQHTSAGRRYSAAPVALMQPSPRSPHQRQPSPAARSPPAALQKQRMGSGSPLLTELRNRSLVEALHQDQVAQAISPKSGRPPFAPSPRSNADRGASVISSTTESDFEHTRPLRGPIHPPQQQQAILKAANTDVPTLGRVLAARARDVGAERVRSATPVPLPDMVGPAGERANAVIVGGAVRDVQQVSAVLGGRQIAVTVCGSLADAVCLMHDTHLLILSLGIAASPTSISSLVDLSARPHRPRLVGLVASEDALCEFGGALAILDRVCSPRTVAEYVDMMCSQ